MTIPAVNIADLTPKQRKLLDKHLARKVLEAPVITTAAIKNAENGQFVKSGINGVIAGLSSWWANKAPLSSTEAVGQLASGLNYPFAEAHKFFSALLKKTRWGEYFETLRGHCFNVAKHITGKDENILGHQILNFFEGIKSHVDLAGIASFSKLIPLYFGFKSIKNIYTGVMLGGIRKALSVLPK